MDTGLSSDFYAQDQNNYQADPDANQLNPFGGLVDLDGDEPRNRLLTGRDGKCQMGAEIVLKRIFKKLFNQVNELQPTELDDEFVYQSTISYGDYMGMIKHIQDDQLNCASLNRIENILSNLMSSAVVKRPMHTSLFSNLWFSSNSFLPHGSNLAHQGMALGGQYGMGSLHLHLLMVLLIVGLTAWIFRNIAGIRSWKSLPLSFMLVGFVEFCMHKNQINMNHRLNLERCKNPSWIARLASMVNYDYDSCRADTASAATSIPNIAFTGVEYLSELVFQPLVHLGEKLGRALQSYLNSFTGFNYFLAPMFPVILTVVTMLGLPYVLYIMLRARAATTIQRRSSSNHHQSNQRAIQSPNRRNHNNRINNNHQRASAIR